jgi:outer membrane protein OmpA-like peptidoglycan-associated protein
MRAFITALSIFLWLLLGWFLFQSNKDCCQDSDGAVTAVDSRDEADENASTSNDAAKTDVDDAPADSGPAYLAFNWGQETPEIKEAWQSYKNQLINSLTDGNNLEIAGLYHPDEVNNTSFENLGLARANKIKDMLSPPLDDDRIQMVAKAIDDGSLTSDGPFSGVDFRTFIKRNNIDESIPDRTIIRFQQNSTSRVADPEVEDYLNKVAERVKSSGETIRLTGHTDRLGSFDENMRLGLERAQAIKNYLVSKGVSASRIRTESKGEASPIATNSTREGRAQNRRTELQIIK